jgi:hypothetical protein
MPTATRTKKSAKKHGKLIARPAGKTKTVRRATPAAKPVVAAPATEPAPVVAPTPAAPPDAEPPVTSETLAPSA